ncbi:flagellar FlbD family protein [Geodermatophilus sp. CPCC 206100]|uniref:flagellar FlbD family protein n=1 Tax=Geodermatophilus sp. CPCC 206100 TaxID=3020054 RepID=UPI003B007622
MIGLTRRNGEYCRIDPDAIERIEAHPDTVVFLVDGAHYCVLETVDEIVARVRDARAASITACWVLDLGERQAR